jgi:uncharacterized protein YbjT (DUF2867 family)
VRAATRQPDQVDLPAGVEVVYADLGVPASLACALRNVEQVFLLSDGANLAAYDANLTRAATQADVRTIVKLSSGRVGDSTATDPIATSHRAGEHVVKSSGLAWTFLRPMGFASNTLAWAGSIRSLTPTTSPPSPHACSPNRDTTASPTRSPGQMRSRPPTWPISVRPPGQGHDTNADG